MKLSLNLHLALLLFSSSAFALTDLPTVYGGMKVLEKKYGFANITSDVTITLNPEKTMMTVDYVLGDEPTHRELLISQIETDGCGSKHIYASYRKSADGLGNINGPRFSVRLTDHTTRRCRDWHKYLWEANVRSGFGWCGTMDSVMTLGGNPAGRDPA